ncbi:MAG: DNA topoisomerase (ATP-hydrolyzing) [Thermostichales cyanobacterium SZTDM-1c_bins_54]
MSRSSRSRTLAGQIIPTALHEEMQRSYLEYAMSVIVGRALPDVRDGLKPVHRRIIFAMHELGLTPDRPFRKCARVVGDVLGKYHPHGDQAVYEALVRLVQPFSSRYPLLSGHGNFGSVDDDPPAAMRYTECRLSSVGNEGLLAEIGDNSVPFLPTFDGSQAEPSVLPARLPFLLLNGSSGIAVGMATNIPPHNLGEVVDALLLLIDRPDCELEDLLQVLPGPDFPTGGMILGSEGIRDTYNKGRGTLVVRGISHVEEIPASKGRRARSALVITEFPYQVNKAAWLEKVAELINQGKLSDIMDLRDESDRSGIRVVVECRKEANLEDVRQQLYKLTPLQTTFGAILLTLVNHEPRQLGLKAILEAFLEFRLQTLTRVLTTQLAALTQQAGEVEGMLLALGHLEEVIGIIRQAADGTIARERLMQALNCSREQADTILGMPLRRLTSLEQERLHSNAQTLAQKIQETQELLQDRRKLLNYLKKELRSLKKQHGDPRRTRLALAGDGLGEAGAVAEAVPVTVHLWHRGYIRRYQSQRSPKGIVSLGGEDLLIATLTTTLDQSLWVVTTSGRAIPLKVESIPVASGHNRGSPITALINSPDPVCAVLTPEQVSGVPDLLLLTRQGRLKRMPAQELLDLSRGATVLKLKAGDELGWVVLGPTRGESVVVATSGGRLLRLPWEEAEIPSLGRVAAGYQVLATRKQETLVGILTVQESDTLLLVTRQGYGKRLPVARLPIQKRGSVGTQGMLFCRTGDTLLGIHKADTERQVVLLTANGLLQPPWDSIPIEDRTSYGLPISPEPVLGFYCL